MCFETTKSARAKIAKTDIECWKCLKKSFYNPCSGGGIIRTKYQKDFLNPIVEMRKANPTWTCAECEINEGYHSLKSLKLARVMREIKHWYLKGTIIKKLIIPAGTRYYENKTEFVSETIIMQ